MRSCDVCDLAHGTVRTYVSNKMDTSWNIYYSECTNHCNVSYAYAAL
jgi:hypothetical protein